eukprot:3480967-Amphidinium_carterae.2
MPGHAAKPRDVGKVMLTNKHGQLQGTERFVGTRVTQCDSCARLGDPASTRCGTRADSYSRALESSCQTCVCVCDSV